MEKSNVEIEIALFLDFNLFIDTFIPLIWSKCFDTQIVLECKVTIFNLSVF